MTVVPRSRAVLAAVAAAVVAAGLAVATLGAGLWADPAGDALYAVLVYVLVLVVAPRLAPWAAAAVATVLCVGVELLQLTGVPAALVDRLPALRYVTGTTFNAVDLVVYAVAAALAALVDRVARRPGTVRPRGDDAGAVDPAATGRHAG
ncbi:DUF2809 domain-containing protein [Cellulomonas sp. URHB0016]